LIYKYFGFVTGGFSCSQKIDKTAQHLGGAIKRSLKSRHGHECSEAKWLDLAGLSK